MPGYDIKEDGKIHTRWSDLKRCTTTHGALTVAKEMVLGKKRWSGDDFGSTRHEMWETEGKATGMAPECFKHCNWYEPVIMCEQQFEMELVPGLILHSTIDTYAPESETVIDFKTFTNAEDLKHYGQPHKKAQLKTYALQLMNNKYRVKNLRFAGERWDKAREDVLGYDTILIPVTTLELAQHLNDIKLLARRLMAAIDVLNEEKALNS